MKRSLLFLFLITFLSCKAQTVEEEINNDVWFPFLESYANLDADAFMALHTADVVRINRDGGRIRTGEEYARSMAESFAGSREREVRRTIEFSFLQRMHSGNVAYEVGFYRVRSASGGQERTFYGKFHVLLQKVDGKWKIAVDSDSSEDPVVYEEDFMAGAVLER